MCSYTYIPTTLERKYIFTYPTYRLAMDVTFPLMGLPKELRRMVYEFLHVKNKYHAMIVQITLCYSPSFKNLFMKAKGETKSSNIEENILEYSINPRRLLTIIYDTRSTKTSFLGGKVFLVEEAYIML
jgi:hypothetical protein